MSLRALAAVAILMSPCAGALAQQARPSLPPPTLPSQQQTGTLGDFRDQMTACFRLPDATARLVCYDAISTSLQASARRSPWTADSRRDAVGERVVSIAVGATEAMVSPNPLARPDVTLVVRCRSEHLNIYVAFPTRLVPDNVNPAVTYRVDGREQVQHEGWEVSVTGAAVGIWADQEAAAALARGMAEGPGVVFQVVLPNGLGATARFDLGGYPEAVALVRAACPF